MRALTNLQETSNLVNQGAIFWVNHSGGKDSQAQLIKLLEVVPKELIRVIHADLGRFEWGIETNTISSKDFAEHHCNSLGLELIVVKADLDLFELIRKYRRFPSSSVRVCTSSLKTAPIEKYIKSKAYPINVSCLGIRAEESDSRGKGMDKEWCNASNISVTLAPNPSLCTNGLIGYNYYPIFEHTTEEVFQIIKTAGQEAHPAYSLGMSRLSCIFCFLANKQDLNTARRIAPKLFQEHLALEKEIGKTVQTKIIKGQTTKVPLNEWLDAPVLRAPRKKTIKAITAYAQIDIEWYLTYLKEKNKIKKILTENYGSRNKKEYKEQIGIWVIKYRL